MRLAATLPLSLLLLAAEPACTGTETGNGFTQEMRIAAHSSDPADFAINLAEGGGVVTEAWVIVGGMTLVTEGNCTGGDADDVSMPNGGATDHAAGVSTLSVEMNEDDFCQLTLPLGGEVPIPTGAPPELSPTNAVVVIGQTGAGTDFIIIGGAPEIALRGVEAFALGEQQGALFLGFDVAKWLEGIDIDSGVETGGRVVIDATNNATLSAMFEANLAGGIELYRDANANGQFDPGEELIATGQ